MNKLQQAIYEREHLFSVLDFIRQDIADTGSEVEKCHSTLEAIDKGCEELDAKFDARVSAYPGGALGLSKDFAMLSDILKHIMMLLLVKQAAGKTKKRQSSDGDITEALNQMLGLSK